MRQMMFAKEFPKTHPRAGEPTRFVEKIWSWLADNTDMVMDKIDFGAYPMDFYAYYNGTPKVHTIRVGSRWKEGDVFVPKIWSGAPYRSKTITFAPPMTVTKTWDVVLYPLHWELVGKEIHDELLMRVASNDGLSWIDFKNWFPPSPEDWHGQIICWSDKITYP